MFELEDDIEASLVTLLFSEFINFNIAMIFNIGDKLFWLHVMFSHRCFELLHYLFGV